MAFICNMEQLKLSKTKFWDNISIILNNKLLQLIHQSWRPNFVFYSEFEYFW